MSQAPTKEARFVTGSTMRHVVVMTFTGALGLMSMFLVDLADLFYLSLLGKTEITAAIGYAGTIVFTNLSLCLGTGIAAAVLVARNLGAKKPERARELATSSLIYSTILSAGFYLIIALAAEQARDAKQREELEQKRVLDESRAMLREQVTAAMAQLSPEAHQAWARMMLYLVNTNGARKSQSAEHLAALSQLPIDVVYDIVKPLMAAQIVRQGYAGHAQEPQFEVVHDAMAGALLEWHSQYLSKQGQQSTPEPRQSR